MVNRHKHAVKMELKRQNNVAAGLVSERFPTVSGIVIHMTYYRRAVNPVLMERTVNIFPSSYAYFKMDCMIKGCDGGGFDLSSVVADMVKGRKKVKKGNFVCQGKIETLESDHAHIEYETVIQYGRAAEAVSPDLN